MRSFPGNFCCDRVRTVLAFTRDGSVPTDLEHAFQSNRGYKFYVAATLPEALRHAADVQIDAILFWFVADRDLQTLRELRRASPGSPVILCLEHDLTAASAEEARNIGVRAFLSTTSCVETYRQCLRCCMQDPVFAKPLSMAASKTSKTS